MAIVSPSILAADFAHLADDCQKVLSPESPYLHIDVMDGVYVPNISIGLPVLSSLKKALPEAIFDVHLMIEHPGDYIEAFANAGANWITFHLETTGDETADVLRAVRAAGCKVGLSINPGTDIEELFPYLSHLDIVLIMSVEPGFGGQSFMPEAIERIEALRGELISQGLLTDVQIEVDGGITDETAPECVEAGADILVAGSYIFGADDPAQALKFLQDLER